MTKPIQFKRRWIQANAIQPADQNTRIQQVYVWVYTSDKKIVLVSKDGKNWQFPGGRHEKAESILDTGVRELWEEIGLNLHNSKELKFFGYYEIEEENDKYLQVRFLHNLQKHSNEVKLDTINEVDPNDKIEFIEIVSLPRATQMISWLKETEEFRIASEVIKS